MNCSGSQFDFAKFWEVFERNRLAANLSLKSVWLGAGARLGCLSLTGLGKGMLKWLAKDKF